MYKEIYPVIGREKSLPFYLTGIGVHNPEFTIEREAGLISHQFLITLAGEGRLEIDGKSFSLTPGMLLYLPPKLAHKYYTCGEEWETAWLVFRGEELEQIMPRLGFVSYEIYHGIDCEGYMAVFNRIFAAVSDHVQGSERCSGLIYELVLKVHRHMLESEYTQSFSGIVENTVTYIDQNYQDDVTLDDLAKYSQVSRQHLCRVFKQRMHMRPMEYMAYRRIAQAKLLLIHEDITIAQVAKKVGFSGNTYFGMVFKKLEGITPAEFRRTNGTTKV